MKPHLTYAHNYWKNLVRPGDLIIDATVGNGYDTLFLASLLQGQGQLIGYDIQEKALDQTQERLRVLPEHEREIVFLKCQSHAHFDEVNVQLIVYNLGYLPGGNKELTTQMETTLQSLKNALRIVRRGGAISITCYPGHAEGYKEQGAILDYLQTLPSAQWNICFHQWLRARKEITSQSETARKLPRIDDRKSVHISNIDRLAIVDPRGFGAVSDAEVIPLQALNRPLSPTLIWLQDVPDA